MKIGAIVLHFQNTLDRNSRKNKMFFFNSQCLFYHVPIQDPIFGIYETNKGKNDAFKLYEKH